MKATESRSCWKSLESKQRKRQKKTRGVRPGNRLGLAVLGIGLTGSGQRAPFTNRRQLFQLLPYACWIRPQYFLVLDLSSGRKNEVLSRCRHSPRRQTPTIPLSSQAWTMQRKQRTVLDEQEKSLRPFNIVSSSIFEYFRGRCPETDFHTAILMSVNFRRSVLWKEED
ncbi:hypothetical protein BKA81DRAFT_192203 [Phyllosticta paracitricarpa]|uniref:Uncharacterized protein n=1 Tax=Phyllosticta paracitricarpa TaxID=2016321 RepID=A0ABR1NBT3_9PEZI